MLHLAYVAAVDLPVAGRVDLGSAVVAGEVSSPPNPGGEGERRREERDGTGGWCSAGRDWGLAEKIAVVGGASSEEASAVGRRATARGG